MMVLKTEWTQLETIELQSDSSLSGKLSQQQYLSTELSGKASPVSFTGSGFGFGITGNKSTGVVVKAITIGGSAHKDGRLRINDQIFQIGEINVRSMSSEQVAAVLRQSALQNQSVTFIVARPVLSIASSEVPEANNKNGDNNHIDECSGLDINLINLHNLNMNLQCFFIQTSEIMDKNINLKQRLAFEMEKRLKKTDSLIEPTQLLSNAILPCFSDETESTNKHNETVSPAVQKELDKPVEPLIPQPLPLLNEQQQQQPLSPDISNESFYFINLTKYNRATIEIIDDLVCSSSNKEEYIISKLKTEYSFQAFIEIVDETVRCLVSLQEENLNLHKSYEEFDEIAEIGMHSLDSLVALNIENVEQIFQQSSLQLKMRKNFSIKQLKLKQKWSKLINYDAEIVVSQINKQPTQSLGINLEGTVDIDSHGNETGCHHYIRSIMPNGAVDNSIQMKFKPGDELLQMDSNKLYAINYLDLLNILKALDNRMHILVCARAVIDQDVNAKGVHSIRSSIKRNKTDGDLLALSSTHDTMPASSSGKIKTSHSTLKETKKPAKIKNINSQSPLLIRSRSLEFNNLIMWSKHVHYINLIKGAKGLGFSLIDYHQNPIMKPFSKSIIVIRALVPNGVAQLDGRLVPGQRLISINELNLNGDDTKNDLLKVAVEYLKSLSVGQSVCLGIQKPLPFPVINGEQSSKAIKSISSLTDPLSRKKLPLETIMSNNGYARAPNITQQLAQKPEIEDDESSDSSLEPKKQLKYLNVLATSAPAMLNRIKDSNACNNSSSYSIINSPSEENNGQSNPNLKKTHLFYSSTSLAKLQKEFVLKKIENNKNKVKSAQSSQFILTNIDQQHRSPWKSSKLLSQSGSNVNMNFFEDYEMLSFQMRPSLALEENLDDDETSTTMATQNKNKNITRSKDLIMSNIDSDPISSVSSSSSARLVADSIVLLNFLVNNSSKANDFTYENNYNSDNINNNNNSIKNNEIEFRDKTEINEFDQLITEEQFNQAFILNTNKKLINLKESGDYDSKAEIDLPSDQIDAYENNRQTEEASEQFKEHLLIVYDDRKDNQEERKTNQTDNSKEICLKEMVKDMATFNWSIVNSNLNFKTNEFTSNNNIDSNNNSNNNEIDTKPIKTSKDLSKSGNLSVKKISFFDQNLSTKTKDDSKEKKELNFVEPTRYRSTSASRLPCAGGFITTPDNLRRRKRYLKVRKKFSSACASRDASNFNLTNENQLTLASPKTGSMKNPNETNQLHLSKSSFNVRSRSSSVKVINILGKDIIKFPACLEREIKIRKGFDPLGISQVDCCVDEGVNGCCVLRIQKQSACSKDSRLRVGDYLVSINNEQLRNLTNASARAILNRASLTSSEFLTIIYIPINDAVNYIDQFNKIHGTSFQINTSKLLLLNSSDNNIDNSSSNIKNNLTSNSNDNNNNNNHNKNNIYYKNNKKNKKEYKETNKISKSSNNVQEPSASTSMSSMSLPRSYSSKSSSSYSSSCSLSSSGSCTDQLGETAVTLSRYSLTLDLKPVSSDHTNNFNKTGLMHNQNTNKVEISRPKSAKNLTTDQKESKSSETNKSNHKHRSKNHKQKPKAKSEMNLQSKTTRSTDEHDTKENVKQNNPTAVKDQSKPDSSMDSINKELWSPPRTVVIERVNNTSLGISIVGGKFEINSRIDSVDSTTNSNAQPINGIFIKHVLDKSPASLNGSIKIGDRILSVNEFDLTNATHDTAVQIIRNAVSPVKFVIQSLLSTEQENKASLDESDDLQDNKYNYSLKTLQEKYTSLLRPCENGDNEQQQKQLIKNKNRLFIFKLKRANLSDSLGLGLAGNVDAKKSSVFVCNIYKDSIADKHGLIKPGDQILEINGHCVFGIPHSEVTPLIRSIKDLEIFIVIIRNPENLKQMFIPNPTSSYSNGSKNFSEYKQTMGNSKSPTTDHLIKKVTFNQKLIKKVTLTKGPVGFGIAICEDRYHRLIVRGLNPTGVAAQDGRILVGDEIISINDIKVNTFNYDEIMSILHTTKDPVEFTLTKPDRISSDHIDEFCSRPCTLSTQQYDNNEADDNENETYNDEEVTTSTPNSESVNQTRPPTPPAVSHTKPPPPSSSKSNAASTKTSTSNSDPKTNKIKMGEEILIQIERGKLGLGLSIVGGSDTQLLGIIIHDIYQNGAAYLDKRLAIGDQILKVNDIDLTNATHEQALNALRQTSENVKLYIHRGFLSTNTNSLLMPVTDNHEKLKSNTEHNEFADAGDENYLNIFSIDLNKKFAKGLGFSIIGRRTGLSGESSGVFISHIIEGGCAFKDGRLMVGDLILEVNGQDIRKSSYNNAAFLLKTLPQGKVNLKIGRLKLSANSSVQNSANTSKQGSRKGSFSLVKKIDS